MAKNHKKTPDELIAMHKAELTNELTDNDYNLLINYTIG